MKIQYEVFVDRYDAQGYRFQDIEVVPTCCNCKNSIQLVGKNTTLAQCPLFCPFCGEKLEYPDDFHGKLEIKCHEDGKGMGKMLCDGLSYPWKEKKTMTEFEKLEPKVIKPGERVEFPRDSMLMHGKTFYTVFFKLAWLRHEGKVSVRIVRPYYQNMYHTVALADIEKDASWRILYNMLHEENAQSATFNDDDPVESVHIEFPSDNSAEVFICLSTKEEENG